MRTLVKALPILLLAWLPSIVQAQQTSTTPDCTPVAMSFTGTANGAAYDNTVTSRPCRFWAVTFKTTGFTSITIQLETSPDNSSWTAIPNTACASTNPPQSPCIIDGASPVAPGTQGTASYLAYGAFMRLNVTSVSGAGTGRAELFGYKGMTAATAAAARGGTGNQLFYFTNTASDISTYLQATATPYSPKTTLTFTGQSGTATNTLQNWATNAGSPGTTFIPAGIYEFHVHASRTNAFSGSIQLQCQFWEVNAAGADIALIGTTELTPFLTLLEVEYTLDFADGNVYTLASTGSRIVGRIQAVDTAIGVSSSASIYVGGTADTHISIPSPGQGGAGGGTVTHTGNLCVGCIVAGNGVGDVTTPDVNTKLDSSGNITTDGTVSAGVGGTNAGGLGLGPGTVTLAPFAANAVGFIAPASITGQHFFKLPAGAAAANQFLLCGVEAAGISTCVLTTFSSANLTDAATLGTARQLDHQLATGTITGNNTVYTTSIPGGTIPAGGCIEIGWMVKSTAGGVTPLYDICFGSSCIGGIINQPPAVQYLSEKFEVCNDLGSITAQHLNLYAGYNSSTNVGFGFAGNFTANQNTANAVNVLFKVTSAGGGDSSQGIWWVVRGPF